MLHLVLDTGATSSLISEKKCNELGLHIYPTLHRAIQVDGAKLNVVGEIHTTVNRDKLELKFSAIVVKTMATEALGGTGFHVENDIYSRMAADKIVVKGKKEEKQLTLPQPFTYPLLVKANRTATILPGEGFHVPVDNPEKLVEIDPRIEAPEGFVNNHLQQIEEGTIHVKNMSDIPLKIKKNTPVCNINKTRLAWKPYDKNTEKKKKENDRKENNSNADPMNEIQIDPNNLLSQEAKQKVKVILENNAEIFNSDLLGYNNARGKVEV